MFERITLQRSERQPLTVGELAEALLFYKNVHIVFNQTNFEKFTQSLGAPILLEVLRRPNVSAVYCPDGVFGTLTKVVGGVELHDLISASPVNQDTHKPFDRTELFAFVLERSGVPRGFEAKRYVRQLRGLAPFKKYGGDDFVAGGVFKAAREDVLDRAYVYEAVRRSLLALVPSIGPLPRFRFNVIKTESGFVVDTDLDFARINELISEAERRSRRTIRPAILLDIIFNARIDLTTAAFYGGEFHTWSLASDLMRLRCSDLLHRVQPEFERAVDLQEVVLNKGRAIKEAIDSGERAFVDFLPILERAERFREWAHGLPPDANLVREYLEAITSDDWISSMPVKVLRYIFGVQAQIANAALAGIPGIVLSAVDSLLLDRLLRGWKPNHFK